MRSATAIPRSGFRPAINSRTIWRHRAPDHHHKRPDMNKDASLRSDCARCAGLCCVALAFDRAPLFAHDKPAGQPCTHLQADRCRIHASRATRGYAGCVSYDCLGAGQLVTQELFGGRSWWDCGDGGQAMFAAFAQARQVQQWRQLLLTAGDLQLGTALDQQRQRLLAQLAPAEDWSVQAHERMAGREMRAEITAFLGRLRGLVRRP